MAGRHIATHKCSRKTHLMVLYAIFWENKVCLATLNALLQTKTSYVFIPRALTALHYLLASSVGKPTFATVENPWL